MSTETPTEIPAEAAVETPAAPAVAETTAPAETPVENATPKETPAEKPVEKPVETLAAAPVENATPVEPAATPSEQKPEVAAASSIPKDNRPFEDIRRSRVAFTPKFCDEDLPPLKPLKFCHVSPAVAGKIHRTKNYTNTLICDQKIAIEQLRHIRRNLEREERELRIFQRELELYRTPRKWSSTYY